tara:strand:- start:726 stop:3125 length:2400 start_codon:yes stop_codon:yes gene_type:complete
MTKNFFLFSLFSLCLISSFSQSIIAGKIVDVSDIGIPYADILLLDEEGNWTNDRTSSDENGDFELSTKETGKFKISIISIGFEKYESDYFPLILNKSVNLKTINLEQESFELNDVDVTATRKVPYKREIDRTVIDLQDDSTTSGSTLLDVLERTPGVVVDRQNQSISMLGKAGVNVMINGKINYMPTSALVEFLNGMNAENAKAIELITTPPAKFDAEGNAGYINIELKKKVDEGYNSSISSSIGMGDDKAIKNFGSNFNLNKRKSHLIFNYSVTDNEMPFGGQVNRELLVDDELLVTSLDGIRDNNRLVQNLRLSYDYDLNESLNIGSSLSGYSNTYWTNEDKVASYSDRILNPDIYKMEEENYWRSIQATFFASLKKSDKTQFDYNFDYLEYFNEQPQDYNIEINSQNFTEILNLYSFKSSPFKIIVNSFDYETEFNNKINFTAGFKFVKNNFNNSNEIFRNDVIDNDFVNKSDLEENITALYSQFKFDLSDKLKLQSGVRFENTSTIVKSLKDNEVFVDRNYGNFFPSLFLGYKLNDFSNVNFSASKRINRPAFTDLAPFIYFLDLDQVFQGNVALLPSFTNNIQIDYRFKSINVSLQYSDEKDVISKFQPSVDKNTGFVTLIPDNIDSQKSLSAIISYSFYPISPWNVRFFTTFITTTLEDIRDANYVYSVSNKSVRLNLNNSIDLGKNYSLQLWGFYNSRSVNGINITLPNGSLNLGIQKKVNNLTFTLNATNILDTQQWRFESINEEIQYYQNFNIDFVPPQVKFSVAVNFGNQNVKIKKIRESQESNRVKIN